MKASIWRIILGAAGVIGIVAMLVRG